MKFNYENENIGESDLWNAPDPTVLKSHHIQQWNVEHRESTEEALNLSQNTRLAEFQQDRVAFAQYSGEH